MKQHSLETEKSFATTEEDCGSRTTYSQSQSSFHSEEAPSGLDLVNEMVEDMTKELRVVEAELQPKQGLLNFHLSSIREELRKRQGQLREIDAKKTRIDRHLSSNTTNDKVVSAELKSKMDNLNALMLSTKTLLLERISECSSMSGLATNSIFKLNLFIKNHRFA